MDGSTEEPDEEKAGEWIGLRNDIILLEGAPNRHGAPSWTIQDPAAGKFYKLGWLEFEVIARWNMANPHAMIQDIMAKTFLKPTLVDIQNIYQFLNTNFLLGGGGAAKSNMLLQAYNAKKSTPVLQQGLKSYLFFRIPLWRPDKFLNFLVPLGKKIFSKKVFLLMSALLVLSLFLVFRDFGEFTKGFRVFQTPSGILSGFIVLAFSKVIHEMGHGMLSKFYGCKVPAMGIAFIVMWPLLWTDTTDAWRLKSHKQRLAIDSGGMLFEISLAIIASILWAILPNGFLKDAMHMLAGVTWLMTIVVNLNPFMRFDGYYLLSDAVDIPNLQDRSFHLARWWMRKTIWGIKTEKPETLASNTEKWMILYAYGTWVYRFFLFLGIALLVYYFFFKALGAILFVVEMWWFILKPIHHEVKYWWENRKTMEMHKAQKVFFVITGLAITFVFLFPWKGSVSAPAVYKAQHEIPLLSMQAANIKERHVHNGAHVEQGDILYTLESPSIEHERDKSEIQLNTLKQDYKNKSISRQTYRDAALLEGKIKREQSSVRYSRAQQDTLLIRAPMSGVVVDTPDDFQNSNLVEKRELLGILISDNRQVEVFVDETDIEYFREGSDAVFYDQSGRLPPLNASVVRIERSPVKNILYPELSADKGGDIPVSYHPETNQPVPAERRYRVVLSPNPDATTVPYTLVGTARIDTQPQSLLTKVYRKIVSILIQESGL